MKVLLLGGTGAMGTFLGKILVEQGIETYITSRSERESSNGITYIKGNAKDSSFLEKLLAEKWDAIVDFMVYDTMSFRERVEHILCSTSQYVYLSSSRVYADAQGKITEESSRLLDVTDDKVYLATDEYALTKARQENILRESKHNNWTIIRPYITYGDERLQLGILEKESWLSRALSGKSIVFNRDIASRLTTLTSGYDVARAIAMLIGKESAYGEAFHITNNKSIVWSRVLDIYLEILESHLGKRPIVKYVSLDKFISCYNSIYQIRYDRLFDREFDNSKIGKYIDVNEFTEAEDGLREMLTKFIQSPKFLPINKKQESKINILIGEGKVSDYTLVLQGVVKRVIHKILNVIKLK